MSKNDTRYLQQPLVNWLITFGNSIGDKVFSTTNIAVMYCLHLQQKEVQIFSYSLLKIRM